MSSTSEDEIAYALQSTQIKEEEIPDEPEQFSSAALWGRLTRQAPTLQKATFVGPQASSVCTQWAQRDVITAKLRKYTTTYTRGRDDVFSAGMPVESDAATFYSPSRKKCVRFKTIEKTLYVEVWGEGEGIQAVWSIPDTLHGPVCTDEWFGGLAFSPDETMFVYVAEQVEPRLPEGTEYTGLSSWQNNWQSKFQENARDPFGEGLIACRYPYLFLGDIKTETSTEYADGKHKLHFGDPQWSPDGSIITVTAQKRPCFDVDNDDQSRHSTDDEALPTIHGALNEKPYELGLRYCYNRYQEILVVKAPASSKKIKQTFGRSGVRFQRVSNPHDLDDFCCYSPRFSPDSAHIIFLSYPRLTEYRGEGKVLPHNATKVLRAVSISRNGFYMPEPFVDSNVPVTILPIPVKPGVDDFPGLYVDALPKTPWLDDNTIALTSVWHCHRRILRASFRRTVNNTFAFVNAKDDVIDCVDWMDDFSDALLSVGCDAKSSSMSLLDLRDEFALVAWSTLAHPNQIACINTKDGTVTRITPAPETPILGDCDVCTQFLTLNEEEEGDMFNRPADAVPDDSVNLENDFHVTMACPVPAGTLAKGVREKTSTVESAGETRTGQDDSPVPLIVYPHGGPHSVSLNSFSAGTAAFLKLGFAILQVNYRGSIGYGQESLETLPGKVGTQDIYEVAQAMRWALKQWPEILDSSKVAFVGGSHSGFQGAHLSLVPCLFRRTILRNPVVNIASMAGSSDIPDWCFCETGLDQKNKNGIPLCPDAEQLAVMLAHSPISNIKPERYQLRRPGKTLLQVGGSDRRVPPSQSVEWKRAMTDAFGDESVLMRWYPDSGHPIDAVPDGDDAMVHALDFLREMQINPKRTG